MNGLVGTRISMVSGRLATVVDAATRSAEG